MTDDFFAPPPFNAADSLAGLKRRLRELRLTEREGRFELRGGLAVAELKLDGEAIAARSVKRPARTPEWGSRRLTSAADVRKFVDDLQRLLAGWSERDD